MKTTLLFLVAFGLLFTTCPGSSPCPNHGDSSYNTGQYCDANCARYDCPRGHDFDVHCN